MIYRTKKNKIRDTWYACTQSNLGLLRQEASDDENVTAARLRPPAWRHAVRCSRMQGARATVSPSDVDVLSRYSAYTKDHTQ